MAQNEARTVEKVVGFVRDRLIAIGELGAVLLALITVVSFFATWNAFADALTHSRHLFAIFSIPVFVILALARRWTLVAFVSAAFVVNGALVADSLPVAGGSCDPNISVAAVNARGPSSDVSAMVEMLQKDDVDVVVVTELAGDLNDALRAVYPHHVSYPSEGTSGVGIFSAHAIASVEKRAGKWFPDLAADLTIGERRVRVYAVHLPPAFQKGTPRLRNGELRDLAQSVASVEGPAILAGDLNISRQSPHFELLLEAGLVDSRVGRGIHGTWPAPLPFRIGIDHVLPSRHFEVCRLESRPAAGSDHRPLLAWLRF